jgi:Tol biopolymer transport system component
MKKFIFSLFIVFIISSLGLTVTGSANLDVIYNFSDKESGYASLNNTNGNLLVTYFKDGGETGINWYESGKLKKQIKNASKGSFSPNGKYYVYLKQNILFINESTGKQLKKFTVKDTPFDLVSWSYDSKYFYKCDRSEGEILLYRYSIDKEIRQEILRSKKYYFHPVTVKDNDIIYLLKNPTPEEVGLYCEIVKYSIKNHKFEQVKLPVIDDLWISNDFTVSPDGKILVFCNDNEGIIYFVDMIKQSVIDKIKAPMNAQPGIYSWRPDGSNFIFTMTQKEIYKYTPPKVQ